MIIKLNESIDIVNIKPNQTLLPTMVQNTILKTYNKRGSVKFITNGYFIQITITKDYDIVVSSNIRSTLFIADYRKKCNHWTLPLLYSFVYQWMQVSRSTLY